MLKRLIFIVLVLALVAGGVLFYMGNKATGVPEWFDPELTLSEVADDSELTKTLAQLVDPAPSRSVGNADRTPSSLPPETIGHAEPSASPTRPTQATGAPSAGASSRNGSSQASPVVELDEPQLNALLLRGLDSRPDGKRARRASKVIQANLLEDRLAVGAMTNLDLLMEATESERERSAIQRLSRLAPFIQGRDFYLGVEGRPTARGGKLAFDGMTLKVGQLSFDPQQLAERFGLEDKLAEQELAVSLPNMVLDNVRIEVEKLLLTVAQ